MIKSWADEEARRLFEGKRSRVPADVQRRSLSKLQVLDSAASIESLKKIPGNRLESLGGDRSGQHSIRVNVQYRICFKWDDGDAYEVEVVDYHG